LSYKTFFNKGYTEAEFTSLALIQAVVAFLIPMSVLWCILPVLFSCVLHGEMDQIKISL